VIGTVLGVLVLGVIQTLITFDGRLSSWWTKIFIGVLLLAFIALQRAIAVSKGGSLLARVRLRLGRDRTGTGTDPGRQDQDSGAGGAGTDEVDGGGEAGDRVTVAKA
jgi:hypothetical protein